MKNIKKKLLTFVLALTLPLYTCLLSGCNNNDTSDSLVESSTAVTDESITATETTSEFSITTKNGNVSNDESIYTISSSGTYTVSGGLVGQIVVNNTNNSDTDDIVIELNGTTITNSSDSPIKILTDINDVEISAKKNTQNVIKDTRSTKTIDDSTQGEGAIYSKADLKIKGKGTLVVLANYNNGIHTTKDLKIQNLSLKVTAYNTTLRGNKSITVEESGRIVAISTNGDGLKTVDTASGKGNITLKAGTITVFAAGDGIQAARDFYLKAGTDDDGNATSANLTIYTASYSGYTSSTATTTSYKGIKAQNEIKVSAGSIILKTYDDGLHADYGTTFDDETTGQGSITISGGTITENVFSPANKTSQGRKGPDNWSNQQTVAGADAIHADYKLTISGGSINLDSAYEGFEANVIDISGGTTYIYANDDGVNACSGPESTPSITISGGYLDVTVSPSDDTDGIDSNGTYTQIGGIVITRGPGSQNAAALDTDGSATITGGTIIVLGYCSLSKGTGVSAYNMNLHSSGNHTIQIDGESYTFTNNYTYGQTKCYSSVSISA